MSARSSLTIADRYLSSVCSSEDDEGADDREARVDHRRELAREDLERLRLDLLEDGGDALLACGQLDEVLRQELAHAQLLAGSVAIRGVDVPAELDSLRVDRAVGVRRHTRSLSALARRALSPWTGRSWTPA